MKRFVFLTLIITLLFSSCTSFQTSSVYSPYSNRIEPDNSSSERTPMETPAEFELRMEDYISPATWTTHYGTLQDPVPVGEFEEWRIYNENRFLRERTDYTIRMNVNYSLRGDKVLELYNAYTREMEDIEAATSAYYFDDYERYIPKPGNELILINITMKVDSNENIPLALDPHSFNITSSSGVRYSNGKEYNWDHFEYLNLIDYSVYPGGSATGNLIYEVPKNQEILLEFVGVWFEVESPLVGKQINQAEITCFKNLRPNQNSS